jgi:endoglucanase
MKSAIILFCLLNVAANSLFAALPKGHVYFQSDFEDTNALQEIKGPVVTVDGYKSGKSLLVEKSNATSGRSSVVQIILPVEQMRGYMIRGSAMVKAENVSDRPNSWNGIKMMTVIETPDNKLWPQADIGTGSFDWKPAGFSARIPQDAKSAVLCLGLEKVTGKVWFDDVKISVAKAPQSTSQFKPVIGSMFKGHNLPRLRGTMISGNISEESLKVLGCDWNANLVRWQLTRHGRPGQPATIEDYDQWLEGELKRLDAALPLCEKYGIFVVVDLHSPPGGKATQSGYVGSDDRLFTSKMCQEKFIDVWRMMAARYKNSKAVWGYDIVNEPVEDLVEEDCDDWQALAEKTAKAIRVIDPQRAIIIEPIPWGGPDGLKDFIPIDVSNVVYSVHMYVPGEFTHQGVHNQGKEFLYPGMINGKQWDKVKLEKALQPVIDFQRKFNVHIYIGEFSAIRWAPDNSAYRYLKDLIDIFEANSWDWSYHAFREWSGWSVEHGSDRKDTKPASTPTDRQKLLCDWFKINSKPLWQTAK